MKQTDKYAIIHFKDRKPLKKKYATASKAFYDHEDKGCVLVELFNANGLLLAKRQA